MVLMQEGINAHPRIIDTSLLADLRSSEGQSRTRSGNGYSTNGGKELASQSVYPLKVDTSPRNVEICRTSH